MQLNWKGKGKKETIHFVSVIVFLVYVYYWKKVWVREWADKSSLSSVDYFFHGFKIESTTMIAISRSKIMAIIMHFLDLFCRLFAVWRASVPDFTWSTAFVTCTQKMQKSWTHFTGKIYHTAIFKTSRIFNLLLFLTSVTEFVFNL
jgi:hypothetical protein